MFAYEIITVCISLLSIYERNYISDQEHRYGKCVKQIDTGQTSKAYQFCFGNILFSFQVLSGKY